jgi:hypothetical protein
MIYSAVLPNDNASHFLNNSEIQEKVFGMEDEVRAKSIISPLSFWYRKNKSKAFQQSHR